MEKKSNNILNKILDNTHLDEYVNVFPNKVGSQGYDAWGFNIRDIKKSLSFVKFLYETYFRVEVHGLENIPKEGRCLVIPNHSGQLPLDGMLVGYAIITNPNGPRAPKAMIERFLPTVPFIGNWVNSMGAVIGDTVNCERMLDNDEAIIVFPEGARGAGKTFDKRYKLERFGNGFMHLAMQHKAPIIPVGIVGCEESIISLTDIKFLAKLLAIPYAPLIIPAVLPAKVIIHFGKPIFFENDVHTEHEVKERVNIVKNEVKKLVDIGLSKRKSVFQK
jgi:1-acyl-sn-glycerol-3-phosphate acyltransferase